MKVVKDHDKCDEYEKLLKIEYMSSESEAEDQDKKPCICRTCAEMA